MTLWFRGTQSGRRAERTRCFHDKTKGTKSQHAAYEKCSTVSGAQTFSSARLRQSSLESSELSMSISSHDALVRCSQLRASAITGRGMRTTQAARPETRSLKSVPLSHSSVSLLYTWTYFIRLPLSWDRPPSTKMRLSSTAMPGSPCPAGRGVTKDHELTSGSKHPTWKNKKRDMNDSVS